MPQNVTYKTDPPLRPICYNETGRCFWMTKSLGNATDGHTACQANDGELAVLETEELWMFIKDNFQ